MKFIDTILHNFWAKLISLILAIATWFYVFDLVSTESFSQRKETIENILEKYNFTVKEVPVRPVFRGSSPAGYRTVLENVKVKPSSISILGPESVIEDVTELRTERINLGEYTRSVNLRLGVRSDVRALRLEDKVVDVFLPVEKVKGNKAK